MQTKIYCKTTSKGKQSFYIYLNGKNYFLFEQDYRVSNKSFFKNGFYLNEKINFSKTHSTATRNTLTKILYYIKYIEKEFNVAILEKTKLKNSNYKTKYKRNKFKLNQYELAS